MNQISLLLPSKRVQTSEDSSLSWWITGSEINDKTAEILDKYKPVEKTIERSNFQELELVYWLKVYKSNTWELILKKDNWELINLKELFFDCLHIDNPDKKFHDNEDLIRFSIEFWTIIFNDKQGYSWIFLPDFWKIEYFPLWSSLKNITFHHWKIVIELIGKEKWNDMVYILNHFWEFGMQNNSKVKKPVQNKLKNNGTNIKWTNQETTPEIENEILQINTFEVCTKYIHLWKDWELFMSWDKMYIIWSEVTQKIALDIDWIGRDLEWYNRHNNKNYLFSVEQGLPIYDSRFEWERIDWVEVHWDSYAILKSSKKWYYSIYSLKHERFVTALDDKIVGYKVDTRYKKPCLKVKREWWVSVLWIKLWEVFENKKR